MTNDKEGQALDADRQDQEKRRMLHEYRMRPRKRQGMSVEKRLHYLESEQTLLRAAVKELQLEVAALKGEG